MAQGWLAQPGILSKMQDAISPIATSHIAEPRIAIMKQLSPLACRPLPCTAYGAALRLGVSGRKCAPVLPRRFRVVHRKV